MLVQRAAHQPVVLDVLPEDHRRPGLLRPDYRSPVPGRFQWRAWAADPEGITGEALLNFVNAELFPGLKSLSVRQVINRINGIDFNNLADRQHFRDIYEQILNDLQSAGNAGRRSVAKVDELMALCDRLEVSLVSHDTARTRRLNALLAQALAPAAAPERQAAE
ncbi:MAG TPA: hypothetical protein VH855_12840 [Acetobacteraceae bacterium]|jgi:hypothetical protein